MRTHEEWKVLTHMARDGPPTSSATRSRISAAALLVKVIARIEPGWAPRAEISQAMRRVSTRVLPDPAPATTSTGPGSWETAARWASFSPSRSVSERAARRVRAAATGLGSEPSEDDGGRAPAGTGKGNVMTGPA